MTEQTPCGMEKQMSVSEWRFRLLCKNSGVSFLDILRFLNLFIHVIFGHFVLPSNFILRQLDVKSSVQVLISRFFSVGVYFPFSYLRNSVQIWGFESRQSHRFTMTSSVPPPLPLFPRPHCTLARYGRNWLQDLFGKGCVTQGLYRKAIRLPHSRGYQRMPSRRRKFHRVGERCLNLQDPERPQRTSYCACEYHNYIYTICLFLGSTVCKKTWCYAS